MPSDKFARYVEDGDRAIRLHPDYNHRSTPDARGVDYQTAASDMIASILHAVFDVENPDTGHAMFGEPQELLDHALGSYRMDQEDRDDR